MTEINETVACDGTCGLSPADCADQHPDPMMALRAQIGEAIATWAGARMTICEHTQLIEYGAAADAVVATIEAHPALTIRHYAPTQSAYDAACKALEKHRARADEAEAWQARARKLASDQHLRHVVDGNCVKDCRGCYLERFLMAVDPMVANP